jgi:L-ribulose-5-phosphate 4-epimerase
MLEDLKREVLEANLLLVRWGLVIETFGNASGIARREGLVVIKPSGVPYTTMEAEDLVVTDLEGKVVEGHLRPSSDLPTHLALYRAFPTIGGVAHTHSHYATAWAQSGVEIPALGTTHADHFYGAVPVTDPLTPEEIDGEYETHTGKVIVRRFEKLDPMQMPAVLVRSHGPFCWGREAIEAAHVSLLLEEVARTAMYTRMINPAASNIQQPLLDRHFLRKHGPDAYYGQKDSDGPS